jgi:hypothetical protein
MILCSTPCTGGVSKTEGNTMARILKARGRRRRCRCCGPRTGPLCDACLDREARNRRALSEVLVRYVLWPEMYIEDGEAGA